MRTSFRVLISLVLVLFSLGRESTNATALPTLSLSSFRRDIKNSTLLELVGQYRQFKLHVETAKDVMLKANLLEQVKLKKLAIEEQLDIPDDVTLTTTVSPTGGVVQEPVAVVGTSPPIVLASMGTTRTLGMPSLAIPSPSSPYLPIATESTVEPVTVLTGTGSLVVLASMGTTRTVEVSSASATVTVTVTPSSTSVAPTPVP